MEKDFKNWHNKKSDLESLPQRPFFHEKEIWFCYLGQNVGFEQDGQIKDFIRPILIIRKFSDKIFWGIPLTKPKKKLNEDTEKYFFDFSFLEDVTSRAIISQVRLIDAKRLARLMGEIEKEDFDKIIKKLKELLP